MPPLNLPLAPVCAGWSHSQDLGNRTATPGAEERERNAVIQNVYPSKRSSFWIPFIKCYLRSSLNTQQWAGYVLIMLKLRKRLLILNRRCIWVVLSRLLQDTLWVTRSWDKKKNRSIHLVPFSTAKVFSSPDNTLFVVSHAWLWFTFTSDSIRRDTLSRFRSTAGNLKCGLWKCYC